MARTLVPSEGARLHTAGCSRQADGRILDTPPASEMVEVRIQCLAEVGHQGHTAVPGAPPNLQEQARR